MSDKKLELFIKATVFLIIFLLLMTFVVFFVEILPEPNLLQK